MGGVIANIGFGLGAINYLLTAGYFFSNDQTGLGLIQLLVPPAELILPWIASPTLGVISLISLLMILVGSAIRRN
jgi:hypothetical protein